MTKNFLIGVLLLSQLTILAQEKVITGKVTDSNGMPLIGASINQVNTNNYTGTDFNGLFHLLIDERYTSQLKIELVGYKSITISSLDAVSGLLKVNMTIDEVSDEYIHIENQETYLIRKSKYGFILSLQPGFIFNDFGDFRSLLKDYNVDLMNKSNGIFSVELGGTYKRYYVGLNFGWGRNSSDDRDPLEIKFNTTQYGLHLGYVLLNSKRLLFTPKIAVTWNRYRLLNNDKDYKIPINKYISERDLDLRFNQMTGFVGFNLSYKIYKTIFLPSDYFTFGIYGGYAFKLHDKPWIYSRGNRLTSNKEIALESYNVGILFSFNIDHY